MSTPTIQDVVEAFESFGDAVIQPMALVRALEQRGFSTEAIPTAINAAFVSGNLIQTDSGGIRKF